MNMKQKRIMSLLLCIVMIITMLPAKAYAADTQQALILSPGQDEVRSVSHSEGGSNTYKNFTVSFELNGGTGSDNPQMVAAGGKVTQPQGITKEGSGRLVSGGRLYNPLGF